MKKLIVLLLVGAFAGQAYGQDRIMGSDDTSKLAGIFSDVSTYHDECVDWTNPDQARMTTWLDDLAHSMNVRYAAPGEKYDFEFMKAVHDQNEAQKLLIEKIGTERWCAQTKWEVYKALDAFDK